MAGEAVGASGVAAAGAVPELAFRVEDAGVLEFAAVPTLRFGLRLESDRPVRSAVLTAQLRIAVASRSYDPAAQARLVELFGEPERWGATARSLFWTQTTALVPAFTGSARVDLPVPCTYDFDVAAAKYFHAVDDGRIPLEFLFSGTVFYSGEDGLLRTARIPWDREARFDLPARVWREMMEHYFPNSAWLRLRRDIFDRLYAYRARGTFPTWEAAIEALLGRAGEGT